MKQCFKGIAYIKVNMFFLLMTFIKILSIKWYHSIVGVSVTSIYSVYIRTRAATFLLVWKEHL